jgi:hypothetical protein
MALGSGFTNSMKKTVSSTLAALLVIAGALATLHSAHAEDPAPTPVPVAVQSAGDMTLAARGVPAAVVEGLRQYVVASGAFSFPPEQAGRPVRSLLIIVNGSTATARIVLGPAPTPAP